MTADPRTDAEAGERLSPETLAALPGLLEAATKGRWTREARTSRTTYIEGAVWPISGDNATLAWVAGWPDDEPAEADANARLLALAPTLARALLAAEAELARLRGEHERLAKALGDAEGVLRLVEHPSFSQRDPVLAEEVRRIGSARGFGALMHEASFQWARRLEETGTPKGGEFVAGPCRGTVDATLAKVRAALATPAREGGEAGPMPVSGNERTGKRP